MAKYRKKPVEVEAVQWDGENLKEVLEFSNKSYIAEDNYTVKINTLEGTTIASRGDYIIKGVNGEFYPCKPDIFKKNYEKAEIVNVNVNIKDTEGFKKLAKGMADLIKQIEINDYEDSLGHKLKTNKAYADLKELIKA